MGPERVDPKLFSKAMVEVLAHLEAARASLARYASRLTEAERASLLRGRDGVMAVAGELARDSAKHPELTAQIAYDADAVHEDLANLANLDKIEREIKGLQGLLDDARLQWEAEVMVPTLEFYGAAKHPARKDAELAETIAPLARALSTPRSKKG